MQAGNLASVFDDITWCRSEAAVYVISVCWSRTDQFSSRVKGFREHDCHGHTLFDVECCRDAIQGARERATGAIDCVPQFADFGSANISNTAYLGEPHWNEVCTV